MVQIAGTYPQDLFTTEYSTRTSKIRRFRDPSGSLVQAGFPVCAGKGFFQNIRIMEKMLERRNQDAAGI